MKKLWSVISWILNFLLSGIGLFIYEKIGGNKIQLGNIVILNLGSFFKKTITFSYFEIIVFLILFIVFYFLIRLVKSKFRDSSDDSKRDKIKLINKIELKEGLLFRWNVFFGSDDRPHITDLTPYCTKHENAPVKMTNGTVWGVKYECSYSNCKSKLSFDEFSKAKNMIESDLIQKYEDLK